MSTTIRLSCHHAHDVPAGNTVPEVGDKVDCPTCPVKANGSPSVRTVKATVAPEAATAQVPDTEPVAVPEAEAAPVVSLAAARNDRYNRAKAAAANGGDVAAVLSEPLPEAPAAARKRGSRPDGSVGRLRWVNGHRADALRAVVASTDSDVARKLGTDLSAAIKSGHPLYFDQPTLDMLLDRLPVMCDEDSPARKAACRLHAYLVKTYRSDDT